MTNPIVPAQNLADVAGVVPSEPAGAAPIKPWPGSIVSLEVGKVFVRSTPAVPGAEPALFVHGLGGSALNWTDLMGLLSRPASRRPDGGKSAVGQLDGGQHDGGQRDGGQRDGGQRDGGQLDGGQSAAGWQKDRQPLACEALDLPGFGYSPPPPDDDYSIDARTAAVIALIEQRGNWPVHLIGNSLGGAICTRAAARRPDLVRTLTLISPALPDLRPRLLPARLALVAMPGVGRWLLTKMLAMSPEQRTEASITELYVDPSRLPPERRAEAIAEVQRRDALDYSTDALLGSARALVAEYTKPGPASLWHDAALVTAPTLLIHGSHDRLVNPAMSGRAARTFRNCRAVVLPRIGHVAMMERPDLVAREMREFLRGVARDALAEPPPSREAAASSAAARMMTVQPAAARTTASRATAVRAAAARAAAVRSGAGSRSRAGSRSGAGDSASRRGGSRAGVPGWALGLRAAFGRVSR